MAALIKRTPQIATMIYMNRRIRLLTLCMAFKCSHITVPFPPISSNSKSSRKNFFPLFNMCTCTSQGKILISGWNQFTWTVQSGNVYFSSCSVSPFNENCQEFNLKLYEAKLLYYFKSSIRVCIIS